MRYIYVLLFLFPLYRRGGEVALAKKPWNWPPFMWSNKSLSVFFSPFICPYFRVVNGCLMSASVCRGFWAQSTYSESNASGSVWKTRLSRVFSEAFCVFCGVFFFFFFHFSFSHFSPPVSEVVVNAFGMTQAGMCVCVLLGFCFRVSVCVCVCVLACCVCVRNGCYSTCVQAKSLLAEPTELSWSFSVLHRAPDPTHTQPLPFTVIEVLLLCPAPITNIDGK